MGWASFRKALQTVHLWAGLALSLLFIALGLSGSLLVLQPVILNLPLPHATAVGQVQPVSRILAAAKPFALKGTFPTRVIMPQQQGDSAMVGFAPDGERSGLFTGTHIYVDPVSLQHLSTVQAQDPPEFLRQAQILHSILLLPSDIGVSVVGWCGIAWCVLSLIGVALWWPRKGQWLSAFGIRRGLRGFNFHREVHNAFGIWFLLIFLFIGFTGIEFALPVEMRDVVGYFLPTTQTFSEPPKMVTTTARPGPDDFAARALASVPDARLDYLDLPIHGGQPVVVTLAPRNLAKGAPPIVVTVDPGSGAVTYIDDPRAYAVGERALEWMKVVHGGNGLGLTWKVLVFLSGFLPLLFSITGISMWWLKRKSRRAVRSANAPAAAE